MLQFGIPCMLCIIEILLCYKKDGKEQMHLPILVIVPALLAVLAGICAFQTYTQMQDVITSAPMYVHILMNIWMYLVSFFISLFCIFWKIMKK